MRTDTLVNVAFIGCGRISKKHHEAIMELAQHGVRLTAVADLETEKCKPYANEGVTNEMTAVQTHLHHLSSDASEIMREVVVEASHFSDLLVENNLQHLYKVDL